MIRKKPLHLQIRNDIEARIRDGTLAPGDKIPFEHELMRTYGCARMTVNQALSALSAEGLIVRRKRAGSFVSPPQVKSTVLDIPDIEAETKSRGDAYRFELLKRRARIARECDDIGLPEGQGRVLDLKGVHFANDKPVAVETRVINLEAVPEAEHADFTLQSPGHWLLEAVPWTQVENQIRAINADTETGRLLAGHKHMVCLQVDRRTWRSGEQITRVRLIFDGDAYRLTARLARDEAKSQTS